MSNKYGKLLFCGLLTLFASGCGLRGLNFTSSVVNAPTVPPKLVLTGYANSTANVALLMNAADKDDLSVVKSILEYGTNVNAKDTFGATALIHASNSGNKDIVECLLLNGANVNTIDLSGYTPLIVAAKNGYQDIVNLLLEHGADPNAQTINYAYEDKCPWLDTDGHEFTALMEAIKNIQIGKSDENYNAIVKTLIANKAHINVSCSEMGGDGVTPLMLAVYNHNLDMVKLLLAHKAYLNEIKSPDGSNNETPLTWTAFQDAMYPDPAIFSIAKLLIKAGENINQQNRFGYTALMLADGSVFHLLLEHGASVNTREFKDGLTPLMIAAKHKNTDAMSALIRHGANVNARANDGSTPLMIAAKSDNLDGIKLLYKSGANIYAMDDNSSTVMTYITGDDQNGIKKYLVEHGAPADYDAAQIQELISYMTRSLIRHKTTNIKVDEDEGDTVLMLASYFGKLDAVKSLIQHGANVNAVNKKNQTALSFAASNGLVDVTRYLLEHGANVNIMDNENNTPLHLAEQGNYKDVVNLLKQYDAKY